MAEEKKAAAAKTVLKIITGVLAILVGALLVWNFRLDVLVLIRGCIGFVIVLVGAIFLVIAKE